MKVEKILQELEKTLNEMQIAPENLVAAIVGLLEITHAHGLDKEAQDALSNCGITLEIEGGV